MAAANKRPTDESQKSVKVEVEVDTSTEAEEKARVDAAIRAGEEADEAELEAEAAASENESASRIEELEVELEAAHEETSAALDRVARIQADWENFRKRTEAERDAERSRATERLVSNLLPVIDDLERAVEHAQSAEDEVAVQLASGVEAVRAKLVDVLAKEGVSQINPQGEAFDPLQHQAVGRVENPDEFEDTVADVYQLGYEMGGKVIRPAMVTVSFGGPVRPVPEAIDEENNTSTSSSSEDASADETPAQGGDEEDGS